MGLQGQFTRAVQLASRCGRVGVGYSPGFENCRVQAFTAEGKLLAVAEDIGRHSALDKAIGKCLLRGLRPAGCGAMLSGRVSLEMVSKCVRAGIELITAVSAPTSMAIDVAGRCGVTLCAFVRETRATVFTHPGRISSTQS